MASKEELEEFLADLRKVCRDHGLSISHEDGHGAFMVEDWNDHCDDWLSKAEYEK